MPVQKRLVITSGTTWLVPADWNNSNNTIEAWGAGGGGTGQVWTTNLTLAGGGGGAYSKITNFSASPGNNVPIVIGAGGVANASGSNTTFANTSYNKRIVAVGGNAGTISGTANGQGGSDTASVGDTKYSGGNGGKTTTTTTNRGGGGGGGAGGSTAAGSNGLASTTTSGANGGAGGTLSGGTAGLGSGLYGSGGNASNGSLYTINGVNYGAGGGGGGASVNFSDESGTTYYNGGAGGLFGGGGGAGENTLNGKGANGGIIITYTASDLPGEHINTFLHFGFN